MPGLSMNTAKALARRQRLRSREKAGQRGAATLIVVMILFFVVSLTAAYASRNLIFEQRTSVNQLASTQSTEAAQAGIEWAIAMLNSGRVDGDCKPSSSTSDNTFRERYLNVDAQSGIVYPTIRTGVDTSLLFNFADPVSGTVYLRRNPANVDYSLSLRAACAFDNNATNKTTLHCKCPSGDLPSAGIDGNPAFSVHFVFQGQQDGTPRSGVVRIEAMGCGKGDFNCLTRFLTPYSNDPDCNSTVCAVLGLYSAIRAVPGAAVTARGKVDGAFSVYNADAASRGVTIHASDTIDTTRLTLVSTPGSSPDASTRPTDDSLSKLNDDADDCVRCLFASTFGVRPDTYHRQPAVLELDCSSACTEDSLNTALIANKGRILWLQGAGGLTVSGSANVGDASNPVVIVSQGPVVFAASATSKVFGLVYGKGATMAGGELHGALVSSDAVSGAAGGAIYYDASVLSRLHQTAGSFVRVPGSWRDFP